MSDEGLGRNVWKKNEWLDEKLGKRRGPMQPYVILGHELPEWIEEKKRESLARNIPAPSFVKIMSRGHWVSVAAVDQGFDRFVVGLATQLGTDWYYTSSQTREAPISFRISANVIQGRTAGSRSYVTANRLIHLTLPRFIYWLAETQITYEQMMEMTWAEIAQDVGRKCPARVTYRDKCLNNNQSFNILGVGTARRGYQDAAKAPKKIRVDEEAYRAKMLEVFEDVKPREAVPTLEDIIGVSSAKLLDTPPVTLVTPPIEPLPVPTDLPIIFELSNLEERTYERFDGQKTLSEFEKWLAKEASK